MGWQFSSYLVPLILTAVMTVGMGLYVVIHVRKQIPQTVMLFLLVTGGTATWALATAVQLAATDYQVKDVWYHITWFGITTVATSLPLFLLAQVNRRRRLRPGRVALVTTPSLFVLFATLTEPWHGETIESHRLTVVDGTVVLVTEPSIFIELWGVLIAGLLVVSVVAVTREAFSALRTSDRCTGFWWPQESSQPRAGCSNCSTSWNRPGPSTPHQSRSRGQRSYSPSRSTNTA